MIKQYIIVRKDILEKMGYGKAMAQASHASVSAYQAVLDQGHQDAIFEWNESGHTKIILGVKSEVQLRNIIQKFSDKNLICSPIVDEGRTVFQEPTLTCVGVGPTVCEESLQILKKLRLLS